jgi:hypothetical protein
MEEALTCPIGFEVYNDGENKPFTLDSCGHTFCIKCVQMLSVKLCPQCRKTFDRVHPNYTLIDIITSKSKAELLKIKSEEAKIKFKQLEEYLKEFEITYRQAKSMTEKNLNDLRDDITNCAKNRIDEIVLNKQRLLKQVESLEETSQSELESCVMKHDTLRGKLKTWQDLVESDSLTIKEKEELNKEIKILEAKIEDCKNVNFFMFSSSYSGYDYAPMGEISSFLTRFSPSQKTQDSPNLLAPNKSNETQKSNDGSVTIENVSASYTNKIDFAKLTKTKLKGHTDTVHCVCYSETGNKLISGSEDKTIKVNGSCQVEFKIPSYSYAYFIPNLQLNFR